MSSWRKERQPYSGLLSQARLVYQPKIGEDTAGPSCLSPPAGLGCPAVQLSQPGVAEAGFLPWTEQPLPLLRLPLGLEGWSPRVPLPPMAVSLWL